MHCPHCSSTDIGSHGDNRIICHNCGRTSTIKKTYSKYGIRYKNKKEYLQKWHELHKEERVDQYLARSGRSREDYNNNVFSDYDFRALFRCLSEEPLLSELAENLGISVQTLYNIKKNPPRRMRVKTIKKFEYHYKRKFKL